MLKTTNHCFLFISIYLLHQIKHWSINFQCIHSNFRSLFDLLLLIFKLTPFFRHQRKEQTDTLLLSRLIKQRVSSSTESERGGNTFTDKYRHTPAGALSLFRRRGLLWTINNKLWYTKTFSALSQALHYITAWQNMETSTFVCSEFTESPGKFYTFNSLNSDRAY